jgi:PAS domain-containing protein
LFCFHIFRLVNYFPQMSAYEIEIILNRQLADCLSIPVFITDTAGNLIFYNEPAEEILGTRFEDTGEMEVGTWATIFKPLDEKGEPLAPEGLPLVMTLRDQLPHYKVFFIESLKGKNEKISVTSYPIIGRSHKFLGAVAIFWESRDL